MLACARLWPVQDLCVGQPGDVPLHPHTFACPHKWSRLCLTAVPSIPHAQAEYQLLCVLEFPTCKDASGTIISGHLAALAAKARLEAWGQGPLAQSLRVWLPWEVRGSRNRGGACGMPGYPAFLCCAQMDAMQHLA